MAYLEELLSEFRKGAKIRLKDWEDYLYIYWKDGFIYGEDNKKIDYSFNECSHWFYSQNWELYQDPIDWDYILNNKCLCWFWNDGEISKKLGILREEANEETTNGLYKAILFNMTNFVYYKNCFPVRRDEVSFYEDREDA